MSLAPDSLLPFRLSLPTETVFYWHELYYFMPIPIRPPVKYHGGKYYLCRWIIKSFPPHAKYVEPFGGAASVLLNKKRSSEEVYNDLEPSIFNLMLVLRDSFEEFADKLKKIVYDEETYLYHKSVYFSKEFPALPPVEHAITTYVARRMSRGGVVRNFSWSKRKAKDGTPQEVNSWNTMLNVLPVISERLQGVQILQKNAFEVIQMHDSSDTLFYLDPPYLKSSRKKTKENVYLEEMEEDGHLQLAEMVNNLQGTVILSGYPSEMYQKYYGDWELIEKEVPSHASHTKKKEKQMECLWIK